MRPVGVTRHLAFPPRIKVLVEILEHVGRLLVQRGGLFLDVHALALAGKGAQFLGLAFDFGQRLLELEVIHAVLRRAVSEAI